MADSSKGGGNFLLPLAVVAVVVVGALVFTFALSGDEPPDEATIIAEDAPVDEQQAGEGTTPEGEADENVEGISDQLDDVDPAAPSEDSIPAAELDTEGGQDAGVEGETDADEQTAGTADEPVVTDVPEDSSGSETESSSGDTASEPEAMDGTSGDQPEEGNSQTVVEDAGTGGADAEAPADQDTRDSSAETGGDDVEDAQTEGFPSGRDAQTELNPDSGQEVVRDDDEGGTAFVPTPSGPEERTGDDPAN
ncbi:hypothetical protein LX81_00005 [Palleronia aestuarii]|uniref:Uncharacterized protein n=1 Tax=Palleronia aestuarii TaxID=568105 RepID=A0A2W7QCK5_9RHOB|nr:hypothetical protein [Palleronia aestuarii]PZX19549.1 hypothetical protein LX81_00005 [Palleronia aestuarii]